jgi:hypothetical protein
MLHHADFLVRRLLHWEAIVFDHVDRPLRGTVDPGRCRS